MPLGPIFKYLFIGHLGGSVKHLTLAQVVISQFEAAWDSVSLSLSKIDIIYLKKDFLNVYSFLRDTENQTANGGRAEGEGDIESEAESRL